MNDAKPNINVTPLIDVLLVLLIIFMVVSPLKPSGFKAKIPQEPKDYPADIIQNPYTLIVSLDGSSKIKLNNDAGNFGNSEDPQNLVSV